MTDYTLDTNILILLNRHYPRDIFPGPWTELEALIDARHACICREVLDELARGGDQLHSWAKNETGFVCEITAEEIPIVDAISTAHPGWVQGTANAADPWLIAHAAASGRTIVTEERRAGDNVQDHNQKIPNVATEQQVDTINFFALARAEGWQFSSNV